MVDEVRAALDGREECGRPERGGDVLGVLPEVHRARVVHLRDVARVEVAASRRSGGK